MSEKKHVVFTYGTLREGKEATHFISGFQMYTYQGRDFEFPYLLAGDDDARSYGNVVEVDDDTLAQMDQYENLRSGLFERVKLTVYDLENNGYMKAWVYIAGPALRPTPVESGDWLKR